MSKDYSVRSYSSGDEERIVSLCNTVFPNWSKRELKHGLLEFWRWKYLDGPNYVNTNVVAESNDKIIGCNLSYSIYLKLGKEELFSEVAGDLAVDPDYRRMGVSRTMGGLRREVHIENGVRVALHYTTNPIVIKNSINQKRPPFPTKFEKYFFVLNPARYFKDNFWKKIAYRVFLNFNKLRQGSRAQVKIKQITAFNDQIDEFWNNIKDDYNFIIKRDQEYLNWRYCDDRAGNYTIFIAQENERIIGYLVLGIIDKDAFIADIIAIKNQEAIYNTLISHALNNLKQENIALISVWAIKGHAIEKSFIGNGFLARGNEVYLFFNRKFEGIEFDWLKNEPVNSLHLAFGDSDII
jgi:GNAT superfamily N-acetyltransferase